jgi:VWFA-related protein
MKGRILNLTLLLNVFLAFAGFVSAQDVTRELSVEEGRTISIVNRAGRVEVAAQANATAATLTATSPQQRIADSELRIDAAGNIKIETVPSTPNKRIDLTLVVPERTKLKIETADGEIRLSGDFSSVDAITDTGTIATDVPTFDLRYDMLWTASHPRYLSDFQLKKLKEKSAGRFQLKGKYSSEETKPKSKNESDTEDTSSSGDENEGSSGSTNGSPAADEVAETGSKKEDKKDEKKKDEEKERSKTVELKFTTARGIVLLNVPPNEVTNDLRERPLTNAAKAIVRSGDLVLTDAIRRASPKYFGEYARTLPPVRREPLLEERAVQRDIPGETIKNALVRVTDVNNRSIGDLKATDFTVVENGAPREIVSVRPYNAPVNLVLLLDVSGSVDNYVNFIRKAARAFIDTARDDDRISLILFNEDVQVLSGFSTNKKRLSESLDTFDAGGSTAYYDAVGYTLADTIRPLRGERTAIVVLTDGDDNRSFLPFESLLGAIEESGALVYPLYVPSALIAASDINDPVKAADPLRTRYMTLSPRATGEGERLAKVSGGVYYPITQLSQIQQAYIDIVTQIRTAYTVTFHSAYQANPDGRSSPRMKIRVSKPDAFVQVTSVTAERQ